MKRWKVKELDTQTIPNLPEYPQLIVRLLALRGMLESEKIRDFLEPDFTKLHDPFLFQDMQKSVERIRQAIEQKEKITIYSDYDADAITALSVMYLALKKLGAEVAYYIPDRFLDGYGMNLDAVEKIAKDGTKLIITVDCGINAFEEVALAQDLGVDVIITDHHELAQDLPQAFAIINPKNPKDNYPFPYLTGVGVAFKLVQALFATNSGWEKWLLDLVAIGTVADCQTLTDENRILVSFGLKVLSKTRWPGVKALLELSGLSSNKYDAFTLGFVLAPRINAAGRIKHADIAFKVLIAESMAEAQIKALELDELNRHRQSLTEQILSEARSQIELIRDKKILLAAGIDWPKGVVGLVAGKLMEEYNRPVFAVSATVGGLATGSARSLANFDIVKALGFTKELLIKFGGHTLAAGFTLEHSNLQSFHEKLLEYAELEKLEITEPELIIDALVTSSDITWENLEYLEKFGPFGFGNHRPKLQGNGFEILDYRYVGASNQHLKMKLRFGEHDLEAIAFGKGFLGSTLKLGMKIDCVFELSANEWNGNRTMQLKIVDLKTNDR